MLTESCRTTSYPRGSRKSRNGLRYLKTWLGRLHELDSHTIQPGSWIPSVGPFRF